MCIRDRLQQVREQLASWERENHPPAPVENADAISATAPDKVEAEKGKDEASEDGARRGEALTLQILPGRQVIHATWLSGHDGPGQLLLWGEGPAPEAPPKSIATPPPHPFHLAPEDLRKGLSDLMPEEAQEAQAVIHAPSTDRMPQPSPQLIRSFLTKEADPPDRLGQWQVNGVLLPPLAALAFLNDLPRPEDLAPRVALGADLGFWSLVGKFTLELLARQQFTPSLHRGENDEYLSLIHISEPTRPY